MPGSTGSNSCVLLRGGGGGGQNVTSPALYTSKFSLPIAKKIATYWLLFNFGSYHDKRDLYIDQANPLVGIQWRLEPANSGLIGTQASIETTRPQWIPPGSLRSYKFKPFLVQVSSFDEEDIISIHNSINSGLPVRQSDRPQNDWLQNFTESQTFVFSALSSHSWTTIWGIYLYQK